MTLTCAGCGLDFEARRATAKWCSDRCRKAARRREPVEVETVVATPVGIDGSGKDSELVAAVRKQLVEANRLDTVDGQTAVLLARRASEVGATGTSALIKEMRVAIDDAIEGAVLDIVCLHCGKQAMKPDVDDEVGNARKARERKARQAKAR